MKPEPDDAERMMRYFPWAVAIALAVGLVWYGVTRWVGIAFDRSAVLFVVFTFLAVLLYATFDPPAVDLSPPSPAGPGDTTPAVAPEDIILPEERDQPIVLPLVGCLTLAVIGSFFLVAAAWMLLTQREIDGLILGSILLGIFLVLLAALGWFNVRRTLHVRRLERQRGREP